MNSDLSHGTVSFILLRRLALYSENDCSTSVIGVTKECLSDLFAGFRPPSKPFKLRHDCVEAKPIRQNCQASEKISYQFWGYAVNGSKKPQNPRYQNSPSS